jgi:hypothetical protein
MMTCPQVEVTMVEIYNEAVRDLLAEPPAGVGRHKGWTPPSLEIRQGEQGVFLAGEMMMMMMMNYQPHYNHHHIIITTSRQGWTPPSLEVRQGEQGVFLAGERRG